MYVVLLVLLVLLKSSESKICRALSMSGSGDRGVYEAGVLNGLLKSGNDLKYNVVSGISGGGINAGAFCNFKIGDEEAAVEFLRKQWIATRKEEIYQNWAGGIIQGFAMESGLFNTSPLKNYIQKYVDLEKVKNSGRYVSVFSSDLKNQMEREFNGTSPDFLTGIRATSAVPGIFESVVLDDNIYVDGGVFHFTPVTTTIYKCKQLYGHDAEIYVDVLLAVGPYEYSSYLEKNLTPLNLLHSFVDRLNNMVLGDIRNARESCPECKIRLISPSSYLKGWFLGFEQSTAEYNYQVGLTDGMNAPHFNQTK